MWTFVLVFCIFNSSQAMNVFKSHWNLCLSVLSVKHHWNPQIFSQIPRVILIRVARDNDLVNQLLDQQATSQQVAKKMESKFENSQEWPTAALMASLQDIIQKITGNVSGIGATLSSSKSHLPDIHQIHQTYLLENLRNKAATERWMGDELLSFFLKQTIEKKEGVLASTKREIEVLKGDMAEMLARNSVRLSQEVGTRLSARPRTTSEVCRDFPLDLNNVDYKFGNSFFNS